MQNQIRTSNQVTLKRIINIVIMLVVTLLATQAAQNWQEHSVLKDGNWVKIAVGSSGVYSLSYEQLRNMGLNDPTQVRIYGQGGAQLPVAFAEQGPDDLAPVAIYLDKGDDQIFGPGDRILFYATANISWTYKSSYWAHTRNTYSDWGYYFVSENGGKQMIIETRPDSLDAGAATEVKSYTRLLLYENDLVNLIDRSGQAGAGKSFYGEQFSSQSNKSRRFQFAVPNHTDDNSILRIRLASKSFNAATFAVGNGVSSTSAYLAAIPNGDNHTQATETMVNNTRWIMNEGDIETITLTYNNTDPNGLGFLDYIERNVPTHLVMDANYIEVRSTVNRNSSTPLRYRLRGAGQGISIWNITHPGDFHAVSCTQEADTMSWTASQRNELQIYVAVNTKASFPSPYVIGNVPNQDLHALTNIDYVIVSPESFLAAAYRLADLHETEGLTTAVVSDKQVYNEFSSGTPDATAIRRLMKMLYDRADETNHAPQYLLLFGDGSFDNRKLLRTSPNNTLITYQTDNSVEETKAIATDDYFGFLEDKTWSNESNATLNIGIGRLPVNSANEADAVIDKIIRYAADQEDGKWKQQLLFLADDGDDAGHIKTAEATAEVLRTENPSFVVEKIYLDAYKQETNASGESYPAVRSRFQNRLKDGVLVFNYCGHGGYNTITSEDMLNVKVVEAMRNDRLAFWTMATCNFAHFDGFPTTAAEVSVLNADGGSIGVFAADRTVYMTQNTIINKNFSTNLFKHTHPCDYPTTLGQATMRGKNATGSDINKLSYVLLSDPALRLHFPTEYEITTSYSDTLRALSVATIQGVVRDIAGDTVWDFNGPMQVTVYDKIDTIITNDNDQPDESKKRRMKVLEYKSQIFSGETMVVNGQFEFQFLVPKDIRYNYGKGRIVMYARDEELEADAVGHSEQMIVGGSNPVELRDTTGPTMRIYLNSPYFCSGGKTHNVPHFYAEVMDENGINTAGSGIGHDLLLTVDGKKEQIYTLNDYYRSVNGDYREGLVSFIMPQQTDGHHRLSFRAWDLVGNSSTQYLDYEVVSGLKTQILATVLSTDEAQQLHIQIANDRPDDHLTSRLYIYNMQGQLVYESPETAGEEVVWDFASLGLPASVYAYKVMIRSERESRFVGASGKFVLTK